MLEAWRLSDTPTDESVRARLRLAAGHPALRARVWENNRRTEEAIVEALTAALLDWAEDQSDESLGDRIVRTLGVLGVDELMKVT